ncbi:MAG: UDP-glucose/GDP-mannose dehydrogenase family protein [Thermoplasmata archaeon]|nr:MAG: UDP-glucose/GDP-mannose dehydrogenase family protein [Thermoplasmata archaeon]
MSVKNEKGSSHRKKIGVIGSMGTVGRVVKHVFSYFYPDVVGYDIKGEGSWRDILDCDILFICVPTPEKGGRLDCSIIEKILNDLAGIFNGIVVIKSTVKVGFMDEMQEKFPELRLVYMPEFLREKSAFQWFVNPDRIVIAGEKKNIEKVLEIFTWLEGDIPILVMDFKAAEIAKLAHNAFIAVKVSFTNEIEMICRKFNVNPEDVMRVIWEDRRIKNSAHLRPGIGPYGGKCVPKDTKELINAYGNSILIKAAEIVNEKFKAQGGVE